MHSQNKEGIFASACSNLRRLFSREKARSSTCNARDLSAQGVRLRLSTTYGTSTMSSMSLSMEGGNPAVPFGGLIQKWA